MKFDFLGLKTVTAIATACEAANARRREEQLEPLLPSDFPLDDEKVFAMLREANSVGVFQLESRGMRRILTDLKPDSLEDLTALLALFRPGPLQSGVVDQFVRRKHGQEEVVYLHPLLESVLKKTYGVMVYQEDVMTVARELAGFSMGDADSLRKAMGKKDESVMVELKEQFIQGCGRNGVDEKLSNSIFEDMQKFAQYAFNRAHAVGYALVAYQTAYLKAHYPAEYLAALATCDLGKRDSVRELMGEARRMNLKIAGPNVNESDFEFGGSEDRIVVGLGAIKGMPSPLANEIAQARRDGSFESLFDLCMRASLNRRHRKAIESMIQCGCLDDFLGEDDIGIGRSRLIGQLDVVLEAAEDRAKRAANPFDDLFGSPDDSLDEFDVQCDEATSIESALIQEHDRLGFFVSGHPVKQYRSELKKICTHQNLTTLSKARGPQVVAGLVQNLERRGIRNGQDSYEIVLEDENGTLELNFRDSNRSKVEETLQIGSLVVFKCDVVYEKSSRQGRVRLRSWKEIVEYRISNDANVEIDVVQNGQQEDAVEHLREALGSSPRRGCSVVINYEHEDYSSPIELASKWKVTPDRELIEKLEQHFGTNSVRISYP